MNAYCRALAISLLCTLATPVTAEEPSPYVGMSGSSLSPDGARGLDHGYGASFLAGFPANDWLAAELSLFGHRASRSGGTGDDDLAGAGLDLRLLLSPSAHRLQAFLLAGGGGERDRFAGDRQTSGYADAGGGVLWSLRDPRQTAVRLDARRYRVFSDEIVAGRDHLYDTRINLGVQFSLAAEAPPPLANEAPSQLPIPVDSDGDGVFDDRDACPGTPKGMVTTTRGCPPSKRHTAPTPEPVASAGPGDRDGDGIADPGDRCGDTVAGLAVDAQGCATEAQSLVLRNVNFELAAATLTAEARAALDGIAAGLRGQPTMEIHIEGHTDALGPEAYNLRLSRARADAVREYLVAQGIDAARLLASGLGESAPVASNESESGRMQNRRVELKVVKR